MKKITLIMGLMIFFTFNSCSKDENPSTKTLLGTLDGTQWESMDSEYDYQRFYKFHKDLNNPFEYWIGYLNSTSCGMDYYTISDYPNFEIIQNSESVFEFKETENQSYYIYTFKRLGDKLSLHQYAYELGTGASIPEISERDFVFKISIKDFNGFDVCD